MYGIIFLVATPTHCPQRAKLVSNKRRKLVLIRFARWFVFKPKIRIWVNFGGP
jgi:hypothetical protein